MVKIRFRFQDLEGVQLRTTFTNELFKLCVFSRFVRVVFAAEAALMSSRLNSSKSVLASNIFISLSIDFEQHQVKVTPVRRTTAYRKPRFNVQGKYTLIITAFYPLINTRRLRSS